MLLVWCLLVCCDFMFVFFGVVRFIMLAIASCGVDSLNFCWVWLSLVVLMRFVGCVIDFLYVLLLLLRLCVGLLICYEELWVFVITWGLNCLFRCGVGLVCFEFVGVL